MKIDLKLVQDYIDKDLLRVQKHPIHDLYIYNYSRTCQFEKKWDSLTLMSRGLVLDGEGNIIARPFEKFFNYEELIANNIHIPHESFEIFEKMDGSLGIGFSYKGENIVATRGSFTSEQALKAKSMLGPVTFVEGFTCLFEIIYPSNRIVVDYDNVEKLTVLDVIDNETGLSCCSYETLQKLTEFGFDVVKKYDIISSFPELKKSVDNNSEGFVIRFTSGFRMKIKGDEYCRLHTLLTNTSNVDIWKVLSDKNQPLSQFLELIPDELDEWVSKTINNLEDDYTYIENKVKEVLHNYVMSGPEEFTKKSFAEWCKTQEKMYQPILFKMFEGKDYSSIIWKYIKPKYQKAFQNR